MKIGLKLMLLHVASYIMFSIDFLYKKISSMITYFAAVTSIIWCVKSLEPPEKICTSSYVI